MNKRSTLLGLPLPYVVLSLSIITAFAALVSLFGLLYNDNRIIIITLASTVGIIGGGYFLLRILINPFIGQVLLMLLLPFHSLVLLLLIGTLKIPFIVGQIFQIWKEVLLLMLLVLPLLHTRGVIRYRIRTLDYLMLAFIGLHTIYVLLPSEYNSLSNIIYGIRNNCIFVIAYFVGRIVRIESSQAWFLTKILIGISVIGSIIAIAEIFLLPPNILEILGFTRYAQEFIGINLPIETRFNNLPVQFYSEFNIGGQWIMLRRAGTIYLNPVIFSFVQLIAIPIMVSLWLSRYRANAKLFLIIVAIVGIVLGITRSALLGLVIAGIALALPTFMRLRISQSFLKISFIAFTAILVISLFFRLDQLLLNTIQLQDSSSIGHYRAFFENIALTINQPWGYGIGVIGTAAHRSGIGVTGGGESWYFQMVLQLGILGGLLSVLIIWYSLRELWKAYQQLEGPLQAVTLGLFASSVGFAVASNFLHTWDYLQVAIPHWMLVGVILQQADLVTLMREKTFNKR